MLFNRARRWHRLYGLICLVFWVCPTNGQTVTSVPGIAQIGLAGAPNGTTDTNDSAPTNSPPQVSVTLTARQGLTISATGLVGFSGGIASTPPTGDPTNVQTDYGGYSGIGSIKVPRGALVGIFLPTTVNGATS